MHRQADTRDAAVRQGVDGGPACAPWSFSTSTAGQTQSTVRFPLAAPFTGERGVTGTESGATRAAAASSTAAATGCSDDASTAAAKASTCTIMAAWIHDLFKTNETCHRNVR